MHFVDPTIEFYFMPMWSAVEAQENTFILLDVLLVNLIFFLRQSDHIKLGASDC